MKNNWTLGQEAGMNTNTRIKYKGHFRIFILAVCGITVFFIIYTVQKMFNEDSLLKNGQIGYHNSIIIPELMPVQNRESFTYKEQITKEGLKTKKDISYLKEKLIHLDLKGAPPRITYYEELFPFLKKLGATGLLIEYEDMFPFEEEIEDISSYNSYSKIDIKEIVRLADVNKLMIIPLVQTFGHLEFVLKTKKYAELREVDSYPQAVCPTNNKTNTLLFKMIDQIVKYHPGIKYLHIGSDEVLQLAQCSKCISVLTQNNWTKQQLFINHTYTIAKYVRDKYSIVPIMWDDELKSASIEEIQQSGLGDLIEIMIWKYVTDVKTYVTDEILDKYSRLFKHVWIASAFKGATGPSKYITDISYHYLNHKAWLEIVSSWSNRIKFRGIAITGWQRYDHFAILCELLPAGIPSLVVNLLLVNSESQDISSISGKIIDEIHCDMQNCMTPNDLIYLQSIGSRCQFPGSTVYNNIIKLYTLQQEIEKSFQHSSIGGWMAPYNIKFTFTNPLNVEYATRDLERLRSELKYIESDLRVAMDYIYDKYTIDEWIESFIKPLEMKLTKLIDERNKLLNVREWPRRPLGIIKNRDDDDNDDSKL